MSVRKKGPRATLVRIVTYALLVAVAAVVVFPFIVAVSTSLKDSKAIFTYPPTLVPREPVTVDAGSAGLDGEGEVPVYTLPEQDGDWALVENGASIGFYRPLGADTTITLLNADVTATEDVIVINGEEEDIFLVTIDGEQVEATRDRTTTGARFQSIDDPTVSVAALVNDATPTESFAIRTDNFTEVIDGKNLGRSLTNTVLVTIGVVLAQVVTSILGGYAFARLPFRGRGALFMLYLGSVMIPFVVLVIPLYSLMNDLGWSNNLAALIIPFGFTAYGTFLMRQFFVGIPAEIEEAALLDGASRSRILWKIMVPLARPAIATLVTFGFLYAWNSFFWPFVIINSANTESEVLTMNLARLGGRSSTDINLVFAGAVIAMTPPILVFLFAQRYFVENSASSGLK
jgi:ABC-type glycerol-3-phosphate transport system permease component